jgi:hypothetical protein
MKRKRYTEEQIISILKKHQAGASVPDPGAQPGGLECWLAAAVPGGWQLAPNAGIGIGPGPWPNLVLGRHS